MVTGSISFNPPYKLITIPITNILYLIAFTIIYPKLLMDFGEILIALYHLSK
ncbi:MAG: hypothetical protein WKG06_15165 [Segetibacter sp.]